MLIFYFIRTRVISVCPWSFLDFWLGGRSLAIETQLPLISQFLGSEMFAAGVRQTVDLLWISAAFLFGKHYRGHCRLKEESRGCCNGFLQNAVVAFDFL